VSADEPDAPIALSVPCTGDDEWQACRGPLESGWLTQGPRVAEFEAAFARRHETTHAVATTSGTTALHLALAALGVGPGDEVIVPAFTWVACANSVVQCGATPVFVDVDPATFNLRPDAVAERVTPRTRVVMAVHLFGLCADVDAVREAAPGVDILEDAACAAGARLRGRSAGSLGRAGCFSFHPRKTLTTGEGGMVTTSDDALAERLRSLRNHGASADPAARDRAPLPHEMPRFEEPGFNYRMTDLQGAVGSVQLEKLDAFIAERAAGAERYRQALGDLPWLALPGVPEGHQHSWQSYVCRIDEQRAPLGRNALMERLAGAGIQTRPGTHAVHLLGHYRRSFGLTPEDYPGATACDRFSMAIPLHNRMRSADYDRVIAALHDA